MIINRKVDSRVVSKNARYRPCQRLLQTSKTGKLDVNPNKELRSREYLKPDEVEKLMDAASEFGRHGHRDKTLILIAYRHALRVSELISLRWDMIDL